MWRHKEFTVQLTDPLIAQQFLIGKFGDNGSCFRTEGCNSHHPARLKKLGWKFLSIKRDGKPYGRCWVKICRTSILLTNLYNVGEGKSWKILNKYFQQNHRMVEINKIYGDSVEGVYTNKDFYYKITKGEKL